MLATLLTKFRQLRIIRALRTYKELEQFAAKHRTAADSTTESLLFFYQRKAYRAGQEDGEQHVMTHAYYWGGGRDENWEPDMKELHQTLSHLVGRAELRQRLLCRALKRDIQRGKEAASS